MKRPLLLLAGILFITSSIYACGGLTQQAQGGQLRYSFEDSDPMVCTLTATMYFDVNEPVATDSIYVSWGDGTLEFIFGSAIEPDTAIPQGIAAAPVYQHVYQARHRYDSIPAGGFYYPTVLLQYRPSFVSNIANGQTNNLTFFIEAQVAPGLAGDQFNRGPIVSTPQIVFGQVNDTLRIVPTFSDPDGDSVSFDLIAPLEDHNTPVPQYVFPDSFCNYYFPNTSEFFIDHKTGIVTWTSTCYEGLYTIAMVVNKYRNGQLMGSFVRDQNVYILDDLATGTKTVPLSGIDLQIFPNPVQGTLSGTITGLNSTDAIGGIYAMDGRLIMNQIPLKEGTFQLNISSLAAGMYLLQTTVNGHTLTQKFVKQ